MNHADHKAYVVLCSQSAPKYSWVFLPVAYHFSFRNAAARPVFAAREKKYHQIPRE